MAEIKLELRFVTMASEAIKSLPVVAILHRRMHRTLSGAASAFGEGCLAGLRPLASDSSIRAIESPNAFLGTNTFQLAGISSRRLVSLLAWSFREDQPNLRLNEASVSTFRSAKIEWKFKCRSDGC